MRFGHFDDKAREYVITTPRTPYPWINYLGSERFFSLISHTSGGYAFYRDARLRRLTRYRYNGVPLDHGGRYFYVHDNGDWWTPGWIPAKKDLSFYECRHGLGYTLITGERNGIRVSELCLVPLGVDAEMQRVTVENTSASPKDIALFSFVEFCLWNAYDDMTNFQRNFSIGEVEIDGSAIYHKTEYRERRDHYAFYAVNVPATGFDTDREAFLGTYNGFDAPQAVVEGRSRNSVASGWAPIGSHSVKLTLKPGEKKTMVFVLGYVENPENEKWEKPGVINKIRARAVINAFSSSEAVDKALADLKAYWAGLLGKFQLEIPDERLARMVNVWNQYQCMVTFNMSRSASYFESGIGRGMGFRDSNQDTLGFVHMVPDRVRERILDIAATQFEDGGAYHQYQPLTKKGNFEMGGGFNDDPLWLILATASYIKETGNKVGSRHCKEGQIFIESQGFCVMAGIGIEDGKALKALDSVRGRLETRYGIVLQNPPYSEYHLNLGEISSYPPGYKENAGIFCHNNPWIVIAEAVVGRGDRAFEVYSKTCPAYLEEISEIHRTEPYCYSQMVAGRDAVRFGEAKNSWLTGTAAWTMIAITQWILGIRPEYDGLRVDPCIPADWDGFRVRRAFRGAVYDISVKNPDHVFEGIDAMTVDGVPVTGNILPVFADGKVHTVVAELGIP